MEEGKLREIIKGCVEENPATQRELYDYFYHRMIKVCFKHTLDLDEAKDTVQDGFIKVFRSISTFRLDLIETRVEAVLYSWIRRIIYNTSIDRLRRKKSIPIISRVEISTLVDLNEAYDYNEAEGETDELIELAICSIEELPPMLKKVTHRFILKGYSHRQISEELSISIGASKSYLSRAKDRLAEIMEKKLTIIK